MKILSKIKIIIHQIKSALYKQIVLLRVGGFGKGIFIHANCRLSKNTFLGNNVNMNGLDVLGSGKVIIGDNFHSGPECLLVTSNHNYEGAMIPYDSKSIDKNIIIEDNCWLGARVMILGGVRIGEGSIIQAGAVVVSDIPKCAIAGGSPARVFKYRNIEHYSKLKEEGRFF